MNGTCDSGKSLEPYRQGMAGMSKISSNIFIFMDKLENKEKVAQHSLVSGVKYKLFYK